jgi:hypothetical protein
MVGRLIEATKSAYQHPLIFKQLWHTPRVQTPDQEFRRRSCSSTAFPGPVSARSTRRNCASDTVMCRA